MKKILLFILIPLCSLDLLAQASHSSFGTLKWNFKTSGKIFSSPTVVNNVTYIGSEDKNLYAIDATTGQLKWKFSTGGAVHSSPAVGEHAVYFGSFDGYYYSVNLHTGEEIWKVKTGGEKWVGGVGYWGMKPIDESMEDPWEYFLSSPALDEKTATVYFGSSDGNLYAVNSKDGSIKWKFKTQGIVHTTPALANGLVFIGSWDTFMYALDAKTGVEKWRFKTGDQIAMSGIQASPLVEGNIVYFGARDANFYALDAETGTLRWKYFAESAWIISTATLHNGIIYVGTSDTFLLLALEAKTGKEKFRFKANGYIFSSPRIANNVVFFGDFTGKMFAIDLSSEGKSVDAFETAGRKSNANNILKNDQLDFPFAANGKDLNLYESNVEVMNKLYTLGPIVSTPSIMNNVIYFGSADGYLYAIDLN